MVAVEEVWNGYKVRYEAETIDELRSLLAAGVFSRMPENVDGQVWTLSTPDVPTVTIASDDVPPAFTVGG